MFRAFTIFVVSILATAASATELHLRREAHPSSSLVMLDDVAVIYASKSKTEEQLAQIELFPAPARTRTYRLQEIEQILLMRQIDVRTLRFSGAASVVVHPASVESAAIAGDSRSGSPNHQKVRPVAYEKSISEQKLVAVAARRIERGRAIQSSDISLEPPHAGGANGGVRDLRSLVGKVAVRTIMPGSVITVNSVQSPILIRRGEQVTVIVRAEGVRIRSTARATSDASHDEIVMLESLDRKTKLTGRVVGSREVEILAR